MIDLFIFTPAAISLLGIFFCLRLYRIQPHFYWSGSAVSLLLLALSFTAGGICFLFGEGAPEIFFVLAPALTAAVGIWHTRVTGKLLKAVNSPTKLDREVLRNDVGSVGELSELTSALIKRVASLAGPHVVEKIVERHLSSSSVFRGCEMKEDTLDTGALIENLKKYGKEEGMREVFFGFSRLHLDLLKASEPMLSYKNITRIFEESVIATASVHGELIYAYALPILMAREYIEPELAACSQEEIVRMGEKMEEASKEYPMLAALKLDTRKVDMIEFYAKLAEVPRTKALELVVAALLKVLEICCVTRHGEKGGELLSERVLELAKRHPPLLKYGLIGAVSVKVPMPYLTFQDGSSFLVKEQRPEMTFDLARKFVEVNIPVLCVSVIPPMELESRYRVTGSKIWISKQGHENAISPGALDVLRDQITKFLEENKKASVILDGVEYLMMVNDFNQVLQFIYDIIGAVAVNRGRLIVSVNPSAFSAEHLAFLERAMTSVSPPAPESVKELTTGSKSSGVA